MKEFWECLLSESISTTQPVYKDKVNHDLRDMCHDGDESHNVKDVGYISTKEVGMRTKRHERVKEVLSFEMDKIKDRHNRYAYQVRKVFGEDFVSQTMKLARDMSLR